MSYLKVNLWTINSDSGNVTFNEDVGGIRRML